MKTGWFATLIYKEFNIGCKFDMKMAWVSKGFIRTKGRCECGSMFDATSNQKALIVSINVRNVRNDYQHTQKYVTRGKLREKALNSLQNHNAETIQMKIANAINPNDGTFNPILNPLPPNLNTLRVAKHKYGKSDGDPVQVLLEKTETHFRDFIVLIGLSPKTEGKRVPIGQMLSQDHSSEFIEFFLSKCDSL